MCEIAEHDPGRDIESQPRIETVAAAVAKAVGIGRASTGCWKLVGRME
jgi:hypothetical protein